MFLLLLSTAAVVVARRGRRRRHRSRDYNNDYNHSTMASGRIERRARYMVGEFLRWENRGVEEMIFVQFFLRRVRRRTFVFFFFYFSFEMG